jgi:hypothetical protein
MFIFAALLAAALSGCAAPGCGGAACHHRGPYGHPVDADFSDEAPLLSRFHAVPIRPVFGPETPAPTPTVEAPIEQAPPPAAEPQPTGEPIFEEEVPAPKEEAVDSPAASTRQNREAGRAARVNTLRPATRKRADSELDGPLEMRSNRLRGELRDARHSASRLPWVRPPHPQPGRPRY